MSMTPEQKAALEGVVGRALTGPEIAAIEPLLEVRNDVAIAAILSVGRKRLVSKLIGVGTIIATFGSCVPPLSGGAFLDALVEVGVANRDAHWAMNLIERSNFDIGEPASQYQMMQMSVALPAFAPGLMALRGLAQAPNPIEYNVVSNALNVAEGRMML